MVKVYGRFTKELLVWGAGLEEVGRHYILYVNFQVFKSWKELLTPDQ